jgi:hypothetical protein
LHSSINSIRIGFSFFIKALKTADLSAWPETANASGLLAYPRRRIATILTNDHKIVGELVPNHASAIVGYDYYWVAIDAVDFELDLSFRCVGIQQFERNSATTFVGLFW